MTNFYGMLSFSLLVIMLSWSLVLLYVIFNVIQDTRDSSIYLEACITWNKFAVFLLFAQVVKCWNNKNKKCSVFFFSPECKRSHICCGWKMLCFASLKKKQDFHSISRFGGLCFLFCFVFKTRNAAFNSFSNPGKTMAKAEKVSVLFWRFNSLTLFDFRLFILDR